MSAKQHRNKRKLRHGKLARVPRSQQNRGEIGMLRPSLAMRPGPGTVDEETLVTEVARLAELGRRCGCI